MRLFEQFRRTHKSEDGFTLIELAAVVLIMGILAAIAIPVYANQQKEAHYAQVKSDVYSTAVALSNWQLKQESFKAVPTTTEFNAKIAMKSDTATIITLSSTVWDVNDTSKNAFCVQGQKTIGSTVYKTYYSLETKEAGDGTCPSFTEPLPENYN